MYLEFMKKRHLRNIYEKNIKLRNFEKFLAFGFNHEGFCGPISSSKKNCLTLLKYLQYMYVFLKQKMTNMYVFLK